MSSPGNSVSAMTLGTGDALTNGIDMALLLSSKWLRRPYPPPPVPSSRVGTRERNGRKTALHQQWRWPCSKMFLSVDMIFYCLQFLELPLQLIPSSRAWAVCSAVPPSPGWGFRTDWKAVLKWCSYQIPSHICSLRIFWERCDKQQQLQWQQIKWSVAQGFLTGRSVEMNFTGKSKQQNVPGTLALRGRDKMALWLGHAL